MKRTSQEMELVTDYNKGNDPSTEHLENNTPKDTRKH
jgi:hypothetical protein